MFFRSRGRAPTLHELIMQEKYLNVYKEIVDMFIDRGVDAGKREELMKELLLCLGVGRRKK